VTAPEQAPAESLLTIELRGGRLAARSVESDNDEG